MKITIMKISKEQIEKLKIKSWPIWTCDIKKFDWHYDETEICYFIEGKVKIKTRDEEIEINKGELAIFPKGLDCVWNVIEPIRKHYSFDGKITQLLLAKNNSAAIGTDKNRK